MNKIISGIVLVSLSTLCAGQHVVEPYPTWANPHSWDFDAPAGAPWHAPEMNLMDSRLVHRDRRHGYPVECEFDQWRFGYRSVSPHISVQRYQDSSSGGRFEPIGAIPSGMSRLFFLGLSDPGPLFAGFDAVLMWTGVTAAGIPAVGALPVSEGAPLDISLVVVSAVAPPGGGYWLSASMVHHGVAVLNGVTGDICWIENGVALHPGIQISFSPELRRPVSGFRFDRSGNLILESSSVLGYFRGGRRLLRIDPSSSRVVDAFSPPLSTSLPSVGPAHAGMTRVKVHRSGGGPSVFTVETALLESGPWLPASSHTSNDSAGETDFLVRLLQPLQEGTFIRAREVSAGVFGPARRVGSEEMVIFSVTALGTSLPYPAPVTAARGSTVVVSGENFSSASGTMAVLRDPMSLLGGIANVVHVSSTEFHFVVPLTAPLGPKPLALETADSLVVFEITVL